ncbi:MAG: Regulatory protein RecX [Microgenomates group bacterium GW2011_GWA2_44_7]|nr:MAG: Regulatory protein RecX [Microgenomates group bacterium GW2011_GWA2_44_7]
MGKITAIKTQRRPGRFNIYLDGKYAFSLDSFTLAKSHLKVGSELSQEDSQELSKEGKLQKVLDKVLHFLSFRPRSKREIVNYLEKTQLAEEEQVKIIKKLEELKLIDDLKFAQWWIGQRSTFKPKGRRVLELELRSKGVDSEVLEKLEFSPQKEEVEAFLVLSKKWPRWSHEIAQKRYEKAAAFLLRRGFKWDSVRKAIDRCAKNGVQ